MQVRYAFLIHRIPAQLPSLAFTWLETGPVGNFLRNLSRLSYVRLGSPARELLRRAPDGVARVLQLQWLP